MRLGTDVASLLARCYDVSVVVLLCSISRWDKLILSSNLKIYQWWGWDSSRPIRIISMRGSQWKNQKSVTPYYVIAAIDDLDSFAECAILIFVTLVKIVYIVKDEIWIGISISMEDNNLEKAITI